MRLKNENLAGQALSTSKGVLRVGIDGVVEVDDAETAEVLKTSGFELVPQRKSKESEKVEEKKVEEKSSDESLSFRRKRSVD